MSIFFFSRTKVQSDSPETGTSSKGWISSKAWTESTKLIERGMWGRSFKTWFLLWRNEICFCIFTGVEKNKVTEEREKKLMQFLKNVFCFFSKILFIFWQKSQLLFFMSLKTLRKFFCCNFNCAESHSGLSGLQKFLITHVLAFLYFCKFCGLGFDSWIMKLLVAKQGMLSAYTNLSKPNWRLIFVYYVPNSSLISMFASSMAQLEFIVPPMLRQVISQLSQTSSINWAITASAKKL